MKYLLGTMLMAMALGMTFSSCEKEENDSTGIQMRMRNSDNGGDDISLMQVDSVYCWYDYWAGFYLKLLISESNNFVVGAPIFDRFTTDGDIACVGSVSGLGKIKKIPSSGWAGTVSVQPGQGYVVRHKNDGKNGTKKFCKYARVYVEDWIEGTSGGIIGAVIRYEDNWKEE